MLPRARQWRRLGFQSLILALFGLFAFGAIAAEPEPRLVRVSLTGGTTIGALLEAGLDVVELHAGRDALLLLRPHEEARLIALGARFEVVDAEPGATAARRTRREIATRAPAAGRTVRSATREDGRWRLETLPPVGSGSVGGFWSIAEIKTKLDDLVASDVAGVVADKLDTIGTSLQGRPIWTLMLGRPVVGPDTRPVVYLNALTHAREPAGMQSLFWFVDDLLAGYGTDPWKTYLLDHRRIEICPLVNPDGYQRNVDTWISSGGTTYGFWRKNTRDNNADGVFDPGDGVDLNRNFGYQWGYNNVGSSGLSTSDAYRGPSPFSEPESRAQRDRVILRAPKTAMSFHTYGDLWLHPWGWQTAATPDSNAFYAWDDEATVGVGYMAGQSTRVLYEVNGDFNDWCYGETVAKPRLFSFTPEAGNDDDGFWPPPSRIVPIAMDNLRGCYTVAAIAGPYVRAARAEWLGGALPIGGVGSVRVDARNLGLASTAGGLHATLVSLDPGAEVLGTQVYYPALSSMATAAPLDNRTFAVGTADTLTPGRLLRFRVEFRDDAGLYCRDTLEVPAGVPTYLLIASSDSTSGWGADPGWGTVAYDPQHPSTYAADSPGGLYANNSNSALTRLTAFDLSTTLHAWIFFEARWSFERDYDGLHVEATRNGFTWIPLAGRATTTGKFPPQLAGKPIYDGQRHLWRDERVDLSPFCGPTETSVHLRLRTVSDGSVQFDGWNIDSLRVAIYDPASQPAPVAVGPPGVFLLELAPPAPNPARDAATFAWTLPQRTRVRLDVFDLEGRRVATPAHGDYGPHRYVHAWDLRDDAGTRVRPGVYLARLTTAAGTRTQRLVVLR